MIEKIGGRIAPATRPKAACNGMVSIFFRVARWISEEQYSRRWTIHAGVCLMDNFAIRLGEHNNSILDYLLVRLLVTTEI